MSLLHESRTKEAYSELVTFFTEYLVHEFKFSQDPKEVKSTFIPEILAFEILLVLTGKKKVVAFTPYQNPSGKDEGDSEIMDVTRTIHQELRNMISTKLSLKEIGTFHRYGDILIYRGFSGKGIEALQVGDIILDFPFQIRGPKVPDEAMVSFSILGTNFIKSRMNCTGPILKHLKSLLEDYRKVARLAGLVDCDVSLSITF